MRLFPPHSFASRSLSNSSAFQWRRFSFAQQVRRKAPDKNSCDAGGKAGRGPVSRMTLEEKAAMLSGSGWMESAPIERLGIPAIKMADGPMGVRSWAGSSAVTSAANAPAARCSPPAFPSGVAMAATWDTELVQREGQAIAQEVKALGRDMILGPTVNINRVPLWGRNFEGYGEDPYLSGAAGRGLHQGRAERGRDPLGEALRRQQRGVRAPPHRRADRRAHPARDLSARLQGRRAGRRRVDGHVGLQQGEWRPLRREPGAARPTC